MEDNSRVALMKNRTRDLENIVNALGWELSELRTNNSHSYIVYQVARADLTSLRRRMKVWCRSYREILH